MKLSVSERLVLLSLLPHQGDLTTLRVVRDLQQNAGFTEDELAILKFEDTPEGGKKWQPGVDPKEMEIGPEAAKVLVAGVDLLAEKKVAQMPHLLLLERINEELGDAVSE